ncbi:hypothetical protein GUJ93_ZPchr0001g29917 [Zizania palustris]|uniref:Uncharacterized protein n=1 Tax=Zizania palustris TaxID=103762 RepID=A0A8J5RQB9_ZIZPA|nr:hypothetical protein GUJ93_ZPchr0001g29917 [Zizania palustris]
MLEHMSSPTQSPIGTRTGTLAEGPPKAPSHIRERPEAKEEALIEVVDVFGSDDGAHLVEVSEGASWCSETSSQGNDRWVLTKLPFIAPFLTLGPGLRAMVESLAQVCRYLGETDLVIKFFVLAYGAMTTFDTEYVQLVGEAVGLHDRLADSEQKASNLEDMLQQEQGRHATFEVEAENLRA